MVLSMLHLWTYINVLNCDTFKENKHDYYVFQHFIAHFFFFICIHVWFWTCIIFCIYSMHDKPNVLVINAPFGHWCLRSKLIPNVSFECFQNLFNKVHRLNNALAYILLIFQPHARLNVSSCQKMLWNFHFWICWM